MQVIKGIVGLCLGDALGVPVEFRSREILSKQPITDMIGFGTYNQPPGTWSDDSSLTFCLMESITECKQIDLYDIADKFTKWLWNGYWTPHGEVFDVGIATKKAIDKLNDDFIRPDFAGGLDEFSNGNGSLMRVLPLAYYLRGLKIEDRISIIAQVSSITHRHQVSIIACVIYVEIAINLINGLDMKRSIQAMKEVIKETYANNIELKRFDRIIEGDLSILDINEIQSSGYVVHTLEASLWSLLTSNGYKEAVFKSINLGDDTDTTGAVTGGLAGIYFGIDEISQDWLNQIASIDEIIELCGRFEELLEFS
ncbi:MAG: ADP-ribosylglycohydrolase family protein [Paenibacillus sp.]|nr:ADP-ribosylglycohydrolase family protein [Paenibacillus sp.]MCL6603747.1 ADP-ribosylglycohydrolase family protein [Paenibacillus sp.]